MKQITNVNDLQEGDVMVLGGESFTYRVLGFAGFFLRPGLKDPISLSGNQIQDLMDHGIPFRRKVAEGGEK